MDCAFGVVPKKSSPYQKSSKFSRMLSFRLFIVLWFTFRSVIYFESVFVKGVRSVSRTTGCMSLSSCLSAISEKVCSFSLLLALLL